MWKYFSNVVFFSDLRHVVAIVVILHRTRALYIDRTSGYTFSSSVERLKREIYREEEIYARVSSELGIKYAILVRNLFFFFFFSQHRTHVDAVFNESCDVFLFATRMVAIIFSCCLPCCLSVYVCVCVLYIYLKKLKFAFII